MSVFLFCSIHNVALTYCPKQASFLISPSSCSLLPFLSHTVVFLFFDFQVSTCFHHSVFKIFYEGNFCFLSPFSQSVFFQIVETLNYDMPWLDSFCLYIMRNNWCLTLRMWIKYCLSIKVVNRLAKKMGDVAFIILKL